MTLNYSKNDIFSVPSAPRVQFWMFLENCWNCWYNFGQIEAWSVSLKGVRQGARKPVWQGNWWRWREMMLVDLFLGVSSTDETMSYGAKVSWKSMIWMALTTDLILGWFWDLVRYDLRIHRDGCCQVGKNMLQQWTGWQLMTIDDKAINFRRLSHVRHS